MSGRTSLNKQQTLELLLLQIVTTMESALLQMRYKGGEGWFFSLVFKSCSSSVYLASNLRIAEFRILGLIHRSVYDSLAL